MKVMGNELEFGDYTIDRYAWILANVRQIDPVPAKGNNEFGIGNNHESYNKISPVEAN